MYAYMNVCMNVCMHILTYSCMHVCKYAFMHVGMYTCNHVCMYACIIPTKLRTTNVTTKVAKLYQNTPMIVEII